MLPKQLLTIAIIELLTSIFKVYLGYDREKLFRVYEIMPPTGSEFTRSSGSCSKMRGTHNCMAHEAVGALTQEQTKHTRIFPL